MINIKNISPIESILSIKIDFILIGILIVLCSLGMLTLYSASEKNIHMVKLQATYMIIGFFLMIVIAQFDTRTFAKYAPFLYFIGIILLIIVLFFGTESKGAQRWIKLPFISFQPAELIKLAMPIIISSYLSQQNLPPRLSASFISLILITLPVFLVAKQPDLGTALLIAFSGIFVVFLAGFQKKYIIYTMIITIPTIYIFWHYFMFDYQKQRVLTLLNPEKDGWGSGWNIIQSTIAIGSGGIYGKGWLNSTQSHLNFLPESHTDFIVAVFAEEFGILGFIALIFLYSFLLCRGFYIAYQAKNIFNKLLSSGITMIFFIYIFVNIGMVIGILPVVGIPLPFFSRGGTSIITLMLCCGILMSVYKSNISDRFSNF